MATLVSTITEKVTLNGKERGSEISQEIASVTQVLHRIVTCPASADTTVAKPCFQFAFVGITAVSTWGICNNNICSE